MTEIKLTNSNLYYYQGRIYNNPDPVRERNIYDIDGKLYIKWFGEIVEVVEIRYGSYELA